MIKEQKGKIEELEEELGKERERKQGMENERAMREEQMGSLQKMVEEKEKIIEASSNEKESQLNQRIRELETENEKVKEGEIHERQAREKVQGELEELRRTLESQMAVHAEENDELVRLRRRNAELAEANQEFEKQVNDDLLPEIKRLQEALERLETEKTDQADYFYEEKEKAEKDAKN